LASMRAQPPTSADSTVGFVTGGAAIPTGGPWLDDGNRLGQSAGRASPWGSELRAPNAKDRSPLPYHLAPSGRGSSAGVTQRRRTPTSSVDRPGAASSSGIRFQAAANSSARGASAPSALASRSQCRCARGAVASRRRSAFDSAGSPAPHNEGRRQHQHGELPRRRDVSSSGVRRATSHRAPRAISAHAPCARLSRQAPEA
jgi:hypothetical protein